MESVAQPVQPATPEPPTLGILGTLGPDIESPKALLKRSKEVARTVKKFVRENRSMQLTIDGKKYPKAEVWQFAAACFGVTAMVTKTEEVISDKGEELGYVSIAHAVNAAGRIVSGSEAACMYSESDWAGKPSFQLRGMAQTRSTSRVLRHLFAYVMVMAGLCPTPAEEMGPPPQKEKKFHAMCDVCDCSNRISDKRRHDTQKKYGQGLCVPCEKEKQKKLREAITAPLNDPSQAFSSDNSANKPENSSTRPNRKKANGRPQPIVAAMDAGKEEIA
jgi:hypothetical protein